jgi:hypothetical protein
LRGTAAERGELPRAGLPLDSDFCTCCRRPGVYSARMAFRIARVAQMVLLMASSACSDDEVSSKTCPLSGCGNSPIEVSFVGGSGAAVAASGSIRHVQSPSNAWTFNCDGEQPQAQASAACDGNVVRVNPFDLKPGDALEVRFDLPDGSQSDWQTVLVEVSQETLPDFGGPGCPSCTYFKGTTAPVTVPPAT